MEFARVRGAAMIDVMIADYQELFRAGLVEVLSVVEDVRIVGQAQSHEQLLSTLKKVNPHVLVLIDELSAGILEDPADVKASQDRAAAPR